MLNMVDFFTSRGTEILIEIIIIMNLYTFLENFVYQSLLNTISFIFFYDFVMFICLFLFFLRKIFYFISHARIFQAIQLTVPIWTQLYTTFNLKFFLRIRYFLNHKKILKKSNLLRKINELIWYEKEISWPDYLLGNFSQSVTKFSALLFHTINISTILNIFDYFRILILLGSITNFYRITFLVRSVRVIQP